MTGPIRPMLGALAISLVLAGCGRKDGDASGAGVAPVVGARTAVAMRRSVRETVDGIGTIVARPDRIAQLSAPAVTRVTKVLVAPGQRVRAGDPLVAFDRAPLDAQAAAAATALAAAQRGFERAKSLVDAGIAARKDLDQAASDLARAQAEEIAARRMQQQATLRAPISGVVTRLGAVLGATVDPNQTLVEVADLTALDLLMPVPPAAAARLERGEPIDLASRESGDSEALGTAEVADIGGTIDSAARAVMVRAPITRPARQLRIGETVFARIIVAAHANAVTVPSEALVPDSDGLKVFVLDSARVAHATPVTVGVRDGPDAEITSGLHGGETVVTYGAYGVTDSAKILAPGADSAVGTRIQTGAPKP